MDNLFILLVKIHRTHFKILVTIFSHLGENTSVLECLQIWHVIYQFISEFNKEPEKRTIDTK